MSPDAWLWGGVGLGHCVVTVWLFNVSHALGLDERLTKGIKLLLATVFAVAAGWLVWEAGKGPWNAWSGPAQLYAAVCLVSGLIGLPVSTIARIGRRVPEGITERSDEVDLAAALGDTPPIGPGNYSWMLRLPGNESLRLRTRDWQVTLPSLPSAWDGLRLVHISDLHFARSFERRYFEAVVRAAGAWEADLVLFTGDLVDDDATIDWIVPVLSELRGRLGTYAILGNHDVTHQPGRILDELECAGFTSLEGRWDRLEIGGRTLALGGTSHPWGPLPELRDMPEADFRLLLSHSPDMLYRASQWQVDLMLSGHNHGGQIRLPVVGPVFMPSLYSRRFDRGFFRAGGTLLHVSQGVSGMHPVRYGCVPEVSRLVLRAVPKPHFALAGADGGRTALERG